jgi:hypothetical protein
MARFESAIFGSGDTFKNKALDVILEDTNGNPVHTVQHQVFTGPSNGKSLLDDVIAAHPGNN